MQLSRTVSLVSKSVAGLTGARDRNVWQWANARQPARLGLPGRLTASGRSKVSGVPVELTYAVIYTLRDGRIASGREFLTREQALDAAVKAGADS